MKLLSTTHRPYKMATTTTVDRITALSEDFCNGQHCILWLPITLSVTFAYCPYSCWEIKRLLLSCIAHILRTDQKASHVSSVTDLRRRPTKLQIPLFYAGIETERFSIVLCVETKERTYTSTSYSSYLDLKFVRMGGTLRCCVYLVTL